MGDADPGDTLERAGPAAPPRRNGELVFRAPWESRLFGLTMSLHRSGAFEWEEFRALLIVEIRACEEKRRPQAEWSYYDCWQTAFEKLLAAKGFCDPAELAARFRALAARPAEHDH